MRYLNRYSTHEEYAAVEHGQPSVCICKQERDVHYKTVMPDYLKFDSETTSYATLGTSFFYALDDVYPLPFIIYDEDGSRPCTYAEFLTVLDGRYNNGVYKDLYLEYSKDNGNTWNVWEYDESVEYGNGVTLYIRGNNPCGVTFKESSRVMGLTFMCSEPTIVSGNIACLINMTGKNLDVSKMDGNTEVDEYGRISRGLCGLFIGVSEDEETDIYRNRIIDISNIYVPSSLLTSYCALGYLCSGNTYLIKGISKLICDNIGEYAFENMYRDCTSLVDGGDVLQSTTGYGMFMGCTSLTKAPELISPIISARGYMWMFGDCSSLNYIKCLATSIGTNGCYGWTEGVSSTGTFVKKAGAEWSTGIDGIPYGWTVEEI